MLMFGALMVPLSLLVYKSWFVTDDAFISFRYARNWAAGEGVRYNLGDAVPIEGYSEFLWVALGAAVTLTGLDQVQVLCGVSALCAALLLFLTMRAARDLGLSEPAIVLAGLLLVATPTFSVWATGGMATMLHALLVFSAFDLLALRSDRNINYAAAAGIGLAIALVRVEGVAWVLVVAAAAGLYRWLERRPIAAPIGTLLAVAAVGFGIFETWRWNYYDVPIANTYYAKVAFGPDAVIRGGRYVGSFLLTYLIPALAIPAFAVGLRGNRRNASLALAIPAASTVGYSVAVGGDFMAHFRLMLPALPFLGLLCGIGLQGLLDRQPTARPRERLAGAACLVAVLGIAPAFDAHVLPYQLRARHDGSRLTDPDEAGRSVTSEQQFWRRMKTRANGFALRGQILREHLPHGSSIVLSAAGGIGYYSDLYIYDRNGLIERRRERGSEGLGGRLPGHDQTAPLSSYLARQPDVLYFRIYKPGPICQYAQRTLEKTVLEGYVPELTRIEAGELVRWLLIVRPEKPGEEDAKKVWAEACEAATREFNRSG